MAEETAISVDIIQEKRNEWGPIRGARWQNEPGLRSSETITQTMWRCCDGVKEYSMLSAVCWPAVLSLCALLAACPWGGDDKITPEISVTLTDDSSSHRLHTCTSTHALQSQNATSAHIPCLLLFVSWNLSSSLSLTFTLHRSPETVLPDSEQARIHSTSTQMKLTPICMWQMIFTSLTINHARPTVYSSRTHLWCHYYLD